MCCIQVQSIMYFLVDAVFVVLYIASRYNSAPYFQAPYLLEVMICALVMPNPHALVQPCRLICICTCVDVEGGGLLCMCMFLCRGGTQGFSLHFLGIDSTSRGTYSIFMVCCIDLTFRC